MQNEFCRRARERVFVISEFQRKEKERNFIFSSFYRVNYQSAAADYFCTFLRSFSVFFSQFIFRIVANQFKWNLRSYAIQINEQKHDTNEQKMLLNQQWNSTVVCLVTFFN